MSEKCPNRVQIHENENTDQKKLHIWIFFTQWLVLWNPKLVIELTTNHYLCQFCLKSFKDTLRENCPNMNIFLFRIFLYSDWTQRFTEYISLFSVQIQENVDRKNCACEHFSRSDTIWIDVWLYQNKYALFSTDCPLTSSKHKILFQLC